MNSEGTGPLVLCLGKFDALHRGHQALAERAAAFGRPALLRFSGMAELLGWTPRLPLVAPGDRERIIAGWPGQPVEIEQAFAAVRQLDATGFVSLMRQRFPLAGLVVGDDFRGGRDRAADAAAFVAAGASAGLRVEIVRAVADGRGPVSSTRVREALAAGDVALATDLLGRPHRLLGSVVHGDGRGGSIGIHTANLGERANQEPGTGVYAAWAWLDGARIPAAVNIGHVPTAGGQRPLTVEAHLIGWSGDCYGRPLALEFTARLREERRFPDFTALVAQIRADIEAARRSLSA